MIWDHCKSTWALKDAACRESRRTLTKTPTNSIAETISSPKASPSTPARAAASRTTLWARRKNVDRLLAAYRLAVKLEPRLPPLVLVGPNSPADDKIRRTLARWALRDRVLIRSGVSDTSLPAVYRGADLFCYPARYEGFGLPLLEAMSCGCPVIAADEGGLPELVGGSGVLLPPAEWRPWAETMVDVHRDEERKHDLAQRAVERARGYSWRRTAEATYSRYVAICA